MVSQTLILRSLSSKLLRQQSSSLSILSSKAVVLNNNRFKSTATTTEDYHESETFLTGSSSLYAEQMYENYQQDPNSVHETWREYFDDLESGKKYDEYKYNRPTVVTSSKKATVGDANQSHLAVSYCRVAHCLMSYYYYYY